MLSWLHTELSTQALGIYHHIRLSTCLVTASVTFDYTVSSMKVQATII